MVKGIGIMFADCLIGIKSLRNSRKQKEKEEDIAVEKALSWIDSTKVWWYFACNRCFISESFLIILIIQIILQ